MQGKTGSQQATKTKSKVDKTQNWVQNFKVNEEKHFRSQVKYNDQNKNETSR